MMTTETVTDFISGKQVRAIPEEVEAVQVMARILVEDYGYPREHLQTHPQYRIRMRPSDVKREFPLDIAVFSGSEHTDDQLYIVVECKRKSRSDGRDQLISYLQLSQATLGIWFNGEERMYLHKQSDHDGWNCLEIPNIPRYGERLEDMGRFKRKDLRAADNLKPVFRSIRNLAVSARMRAYPAYSAVVSTGDRRRSDPRSAQAAAAWRRCSRH